MGLSTTTTGTLILWGNLPGSSELQGFLALSIPGTLQDLAARKSRWSGVQADDLDPSLFDPQSLACTCDCKIPKPGLLPELAANPARHDHRNSTSEDGIAPTTRDLVHDFMERSDRDRAELVDLVLHCLCLAYHQTIVRKQPADISKILADASSFLTEKDLERLHEELLDIWFCGRFDGLTENM